MDAKAWKMMTTFDDLLDDTDNRSNIRKRLEFDIPSPRTSSESSTDSNDSSSSSKHTSLTSASSGEGGETSHAKLPSSDSGYSFPSVESKVVPNRYLQRSKSAATPPAPKEPRSRKASLKAAFTLKSSTPPPPLPEISAPMPKPDLPIASRFMRAASPLPPPSPLSRSSSPPPSHLSPELWNNDTLIPSSRSGAGASSPKKNRLAPPPVRTLTPIPINIPQQPQVKKQPFLRLPPIRTGGGGDAIDPNAHFSFVEVNRDELDIPQDVSPRTLALPSFPTPLLLKPLSPLPSPSPVQRQPSPSPRQATPSPLPSPMASERDDGLLVDPSIVSLVRTPSSQRGRQAPFPQKPSVRTTRPLNNLRTTGEVARYKQLEVLRIPHSVQEILLHPGLLEKGEEVREEKKPEERKVRVRFEDSVEQMLRQRKEREERDRVLVSHSRRE